MDTAKVVGGGDRLGLNEEDPIVYVHSSMVEYKATQTAVWHSNNYPWWLDITSGETLYIDEENPVIVSRIYKGRTYNAYIVINKEGASGYVCNSYIVKV